MFFQERVQARISDFDRNGRFSYEAILQVLETAGTHHSDLVHDGVIAGSRSGIAWILLEWRIQIFRFPKAEQPIFITTWVRNKSTTTAVFRNFSACDEQGNPFFVAEATLVLLDTAKGRLARISPELLTAYAPEEKAVFSDTLPRLRAPISVQNAQPVSLRRSDIDFNGHVHNTKYLDLALQALPEEAVREQQFSSLRIVYSKSLTEADAVFVSCIPDENGYTVSIASKEKSCAVLAFSI